LYWKAGIVAKEEVAKEIPSKEDVMDLIAIKERFQKSVEPEEDQQQMDERKRAYNSRNISEVTPEEIESYQQKRKRFDDPMKNFL